MFGKMPWDELRDTGGPEEFTVDELVPVVHCCSCGRSHDALEWLKLQLVGYQPAENPDELLELRNCECKSTGAIVITGPGFWLDLAMRRATDARTEAHHELPAVSQSYIDRAVVCLKQASELLKLLTDQRARRATELQQAAE